jgi:hypothetical protein
LGEEASNRSLIAMASRVVMVMQRQWQAAVTHPGMVQFIEFGYRFGDTIES